MKKFKHLFLTFLSLVLLLNVLHSQSIERQVIGFSGTTGQLDDKFISYNLGEMVVSTLHSDKHYITQGFFQAPTNFIPVHVLSIGKENLNINLFPNPVRDQLQLELSSNSTFTNLEIQVLNYLGQVVHPTQVITSPSLQTISCEKLPAGYYILSIKAIQEQTQQTIPFVKID